ncbi:hypothetical protein [Gordonia malaquae]|uniref:hypothetical protein n=1 Tax=Gordonia malaquae TaxID=410332 RepID=UPI003017C58E
MPDTLTVRPIGVGYGRTRGYAPVTVTHDAQTLLDQIIDNLDYEPPQTPNRNPLGCAKYPYIGRPGTGMNTVTRIPLDVVRTLQLLTQLNSDTPSTSTPWTWAREHDDADTIALQAPPCDLDTCTDPTHMLQRRPGSTRHIKRFPRHTDTTKARR